MLDINADMLRRRPRAGEKPEIRGESSNSSRPTPRICRFPDNCFDAYTIAFGIRNVPRIDRALDRGAARAEARRPLPLPRILAGRRPVLARIYEAYSFTRHSAHRRMGDGRRQFLSLSRRIDPRFPGAEEFREQIDEAGFERADFTRLTGGVVAIHSGWKL